MPTLSPPPAPPQVERVLGRLRGRAAGPTLICVAGLHGNEPAGIDAFRRVIGPARGGGRRASRRRPGGAGRQPARRWRGGAAFWSATSIGSGCRSGWRGCAPPPRRSPPRTPRQLALDDELEAAFAAARGPVFVLDLHTTSGPGPAFAVLDDTLANRAFALHFTVPLVVGLEEELDGTLLQHLLDRGAVTLGFESGQHDEPAAVDRAEAAVWIALDAAGLLPAGSRPEVAAARGLLAAAGAGLPRVVEVRYRLAVTPGDDFRMLPGFASFQPVGAGQVVARDRHGDVAVREPGRLLMPLYQPLGDDGFFLIREIRPFWLAVSTRMRRLRLDRFAHWLPGVRRHPELPNAFSIDRRIARWFALEIFHLLGFRRHGRSGERLVVSRRADDGDAHRARFGDRVDGGRDALR